MKKEWLQHLETSMNKNFEFSSNLLNDFAISSLDEFNLKFIETNEADSTFTRRIYDMVETQKTAEGAKQYYYSWGLAERDARYRGRREGEIKGRREGVVLNAIQNAKNLLAMNVLTHEQIAQAVELPLEKIEELACAQRSPSK